MVSINLDIEALWSQAGFSPNDNQRQAILHTGEPLYLPAGPGSGKTRVLLWRTVNLIVFHGISPDEIYLSTFTEKAAHQLKEGLRTMLSMVTNHTGQPYDIARMYVGTIHSLCQRILSDRRFTNHQRHMTPSLLDALGQYFYLSRPARWGELAGDLGLGETPDEIHERLTGFFEKASKSRHKAVVNCLALFNRLSEECLEPDNLLEQVDDETLRALLCMYDRYRQSLAQGEAVPRMDFSLMQQAAYSVLQDCPTSGQVFKHVIIDEYQDTNPIQERLIFKLGEGTHNICVVGDDDQALYRFRGATVENFVDFPEKCIRQFGLGPTIIPLDINYRSRRKIVSLYMDFIQGCNWAREGNPHLLHRVPKNIAAHRIDDGPAVVASTPGSPDVVCDQVAELVKSLLDTGKVENENQIAFLFPSLKSEQVRRMREALEARDLRVYAPRAGRFLEVPEAVAVFGVFMHLFGKPARGEFPGDEYNAYYDWIDTAYETAKQIIAADPALKAFIKERKAEMERSLNDFQALVGFIERQGWSQEQLYMPATMKVPIARGASISDHARKAIINKYFDRVVEMRRGMGRPITLRYVLTRATSLDWNVLDLFYRLTAFDHFKAMLDLAEDGTDEGPICNLSLITGYLDRFMDGYQSLIAADVLIEDRYQRWLYGSYLYALFRLGESEYEDAEDPFPKGRIPFLTIHQAKGLEFPVVVFGNPRKSNKGAQKVEQIVHPLLEREGEPLHRIPEFDMMRLFYVALSRAKNLLIIPHWQSQGNFVSPPLKGLLDADHVTRIPDLDLNTVPKAKLEKDDLPRNYSFTADYLLYQSCPRQYMVFKKYGFLPSRSQTMFFGSLVHRTLDDLHQHLIAERQSNLQT